MKSSPQLKIYAYRWGVDAGRWGGAPPSPRNALQELQQRARTLREPDPRGCDIGTGARAPNNAHRIRQGDVLVFYAGKKFDRVPPGRGVYGVAVSLGRAYRRKPDWYLRIRWLPISRELSRNPYRGDDAILAPSGPASTLLRVAKPSPSLSRLVERALAGSPVPPRQMTGDTADLSFSEGARVERRHWSFERDAGLKAAAKELARDAMGRLKCRVCRFDFGKTYGKHGEDFIEMHHVVPLHALGRVTRKRPSDLAPLCSNCHRMIHYRTPNLTIADLRRLRRR